MRAQTSKTAGFTLIELLVVVVIIGVLSAFVLAAIAKSRARANELASSNNLRQWGTALMSSLTDFDNRLPSTGANGDLTDFSDKDAWFNRLPQYIKELPLSDPQIATNFPKYAQKSVWLNPSCPREDVEKYMKPPGSWFFSYAQNRYLTTKDEPTISKLRIESAHSTVFMGEQGNNISELRTDLIKAHFGPGSPVDGKENSAHFLFCDGHVELVRRDVFDPKFIPQTSLSPKPDDATTLNPAFSYIPYTGYKPNQ